jgi:purine-binding chemotaxis protein CheW
MISDIQEIRVVCFRLGEDTYAADIMRVREITKPLKPAGLPDAPDFIEGVINLRGAVIPVLNLHRRFRLVEPDSDKNTRLLIVSLAGQPFALVVDEVTEVVTVPVRDLRPPPRFSRGVGSEYLIAVCLVDDSLVMLIDLDSILKDHEVDVVRGVDTCNNPIDDNNQVEPV